MGLRPARAAVRLEKEQGQGAYDGAVLLHNYGHGGAGGALSWGCAREVVEKVGQAVGLTF